MPHLDFDLNVPLKVLTQFNHCHSVKTTIYGEKDFSCKIFGCWRHVSELLTKVSEKTTPKNTVSSCSNYMWVNQGCKNKRGSSHMFQKLISKLNQIFSFSSISFRDWKYIKPPKQNVLDHQQFLYILWRRKRLICS